MLPKYDFGQSNIENVATQIRPIIHSKNPVLDSIVLAARYHELRTQFDILLRDVLNLPHQKDMLNRLLFLLINDGYDFQKYKVRDRDELDRHPLGRELLLCQPFRLYPSYEGRPRHVISRHFKVFGEMSKAYIMKVLKCQEGPAVTSFKDYIKKQINVQNTEKAMTEYLDEGFQLVCDVNKECMSEAYISVINQLMDYGTTLFQREISDCFSDNTFQVFLLNHETRNRVRSISQVFDSNVKMYSIQILPQMGPNCDTKQFYQQLYSKENREMLDKLYVTGFHCIKLYELYKMSLNQEEENFDTFADRLAAMLITYSSFFGLQRYEGTSFHGALSPHFFQYLKDKLNIQFELFASPLNCYFSNYCSAFPVDRFFNSRGSVYNLQTLTGFYEVNPPFTEEVITMCLRKLRENLSGAEGPLGFVLILPEWRTPTAEYHNQLENWCTAIPEDSNIFLLEGSPNSYYVRGYCRVQLRYIAGDQHCIKSNDKTFSTPNMDCIYMLCNNDALGKIGGMDSVKKFFQGIQELFR